MYILQFKPLLRQMLWGGNKIITYKGLSDQVEHIGESWELSGMAGFESVVSSGQFAGRTLSEVLADQQGRLLGAANYARFGTTFPLLIKFIDAARDLSIQVHPNDAMAARVHGTNGKTEMWYVVDAEKDAGIYAGFSQRLTPSEYEQHVSNHSLVEVLHHHDVHPDDLFFLPAGCVHNIGAGVFVAEIQQTSDLTYRIWDFDRLDADGHKRPLHTDLAREAIDYKYPFESRTPYQRLANAEIPLIQSPYFTTSLYELTAEKTCDFSAFDSFVVMIFIGGAGCVKDTYGNCLSVRQGQTLLVPAVSKQIKVTPAKGATLKFMTTYIA
ncbi:MAG: type I phosphomannose isomerase catalytic subunit [Alistipes sp.]